MGSGSNNKRASGLSKNERVRQARVIPVDRSVVVTDIEVGHFRVDNACPIQPGDLKVLFTRLEGEAECKTILQDSVVTAH